MTTTFAAAAPVRRPALRPIALPTEHGGWGFLFEPLVAGLAIAPSPGGALIALAFILGFLTRQPLKFALQDALRRRSYPRTRWCVIFAASYAIAALLALTAAVMVSGPIILVPLGLVAPLGVMQILYDANNRSRVLLPELGGAVAMTSSAAAIAIAGHMRMLAAFALAGVLVARAVPSIVYVRTLLQRAHGKEASSWPSLALHAMAILAVALIGTRLAAAAMCVLFLRATWHLARPVLPAKTIGWREITFGAISVALIVSGFYVRF